MLWTSENYTVTISGRHVLEILINVFYFLLTKDLPWLTLQVAPYSQKDRQTITMANHIFTSKRIHYVYCTSQHWLFWIYLFCFSHMLYDLWNMICIMNVEHAIGIHLLTRKHFFDIFPTLILKSYDLYELFPYKTQIRRMYT